jgi:hypothetical protein
MPPTPAPTARALLLQIVAAWRSLVLDLRAGGMSGNPGGLVFRTALLWQQHGPSTEAPYNKYPVLETLTALLASDAHLAMTCRDALTLAKALDLLALAHLVDPAGLALSDDQIVDALQARLYEADFLRRMYFRFYNVEIAQSPLALPTAHAQFVRLEDWEITRLTGEPTTTSTLHLRDTGNVFLVVTDQGGDDDLTWGQGRWLDANMLLNVLKYMKYDIVEIDYAAVFFFPLWLNEVRRYGIHLWGRPRIDRQTERYALAADEERRVLRYLTALVHLQPRLANLEPTLRRATATAGDYYEGHHRRATPGDRLIDLVIALEALFSPKEKTELRFRISHRAALLLGNHSSERAEIAHFLRRVYDGRSALVHEGANPFVPRLTKGKAKPAKLSSDDLRRAGDLVRQAILRLVVLYLRGEPERERALQRIENCAYDPTTLDALRQDSDLERFLTEQAL